MEFSFVVNTSVERTQGKFESKDSIEAQLIDALDGANPVSVEGDNGGEYEVTDWSVETNEPVKPAKRGRSASPDLGSGPVDSRPLGKIPELQALCKAWYWLNQKPDDEAVQNTFEHTMEAAYQLIAGTME